jgi:hypothetical protein
MRRKHLLCLAQSPWEKALLDVALKRLVKCRAVKRMRYGVYIDASVRNPSTKAIPPMNGVPKGPSVEKVIRLLHRPRLPPELRKRVKVSRQRVHKILKALLDAGKITRRKIKGKNQYEYVRLKGLGKQESARPPAIPVPIPRPPKGGRD